MWSEPVTRAPLSGFLAAYSARIAINAGISDSAMAISLRPQSASDRAATLQSVNFLSTTAEFMFAISRKQKAPASFPMRAPLNLAEPDPSLLPHLKGRNAPQRCGLY